MNLGTVICNLGIAIFGSATIPVTEGASGFPLIMLWTVRMFGVMGVVAGLAGLIMGPLQKIIDIPNAIQSTFGLGGGGGGMFGGMGGAGLGQQLDNWAQAAQNNAVWYMVFGAALLALSGYVAGIIGFLGATLIQVAGTMMGGNCGSIGGGGGSESFRIIINLMMMMV